MTPQMGLFFSAIAFVGLHFLLSHPLRGPLVRAIGEKPFQGVYSLISIITFGLMVYFYRIIGRERRDRVDVACLDPVRRFVHQESGAARGGWTRRRAAGRLPHHAPPDDVGLCALGRRPPDDPRSAEIFGL